MADIPNAAYVATVKCAPPMLRLGVGKSLPAGYAWTCPDEGTQWVVRVIRSWGGINDVQWVQVPAADSPDPVFQRLAALDTQTAATLTRLTALEAKTVTTHAARVAVPALAIAAKADLTVTWQTAFPDTNYSVEANLAPALVGKATFALKTKTASGATYTVTAGVLVAVGSDLLVTATRYA